MSRHLESVSISGCSTSDLRRAARFVTRRAMFTIEAHCHKVVTICGIIDLLLRSSTGGGT